MNQQNSFYESWDGARLFYRSWLPANPTDKAVLLFHRGHEHSGRWEETVQALGLEDVAVFAWDARGHGQSPGERGSAPDLACVVKDADSFARHVADAHNIPVHNMIVVAHSVGAVIAAAWVHDFAPPVRAMILAAPAFEVKLYVPFAIPLLRLKQRLFGPSCVKSYVKSKLLTHDKEQQKIYDADPAIFRQISVNILLDLFDTSRRLIADAGAIDVPTTVFAAGSDWIVRNSAQRRFVNRLSSSRKHYEELPGFYHAMFHEKDRGMLVDKIRETVKGSFAEPSPGIDLAHADAAGYTRSEYDRLRAPGAFWWGIQTFFMRTLGCFSQGILLGWASGFDSGRTLDYVYENKPGGYTWLGKRVDKSYLDSIGWRGIRRRGDNLQRLLRKTLARLQSEGRPLRIVDIAAGCGRYVLEVLKGMPEAGVTALLRDYKQENVDEIQRKAAMLGLHGVTAVRADAFDRASLATLDPKPTVCIVSGLYELFPGNEGICRSLQGLAEGIEPGGYLIYTNQPWHPQVEFIARVLVNREGEPWIMRRRTQAEMDQLVSDAGFEKLEQDMDPWGIFTVSVARRRAA